MLELCCHLQWCSIPLCIHPLHAEVLYPFCHTQFPKTGLEETEDGGQAFHLPGMKDNWVGMCDSVILWKMCPHPSDTRMSIRLCRPRAGCSAGQLWLSQLTSKLSPSHSLSPCLWTQWLHTGPPASPKRACRTWQGWPSLSKITGVRDGGEWSPKVTYPKPWGASGAYFCRGIISCDWTRCSLGSLPTKNILIRWFYDLIPIKHMKGRWNDLPSQRSFL